MCCLSCCLFHWITDLFLIKPMMDVSIAIELTVATVASELTLISTDLCSTVLRFAYFKVIFQRHIMASDKMPIAHTSHIPTATSDITCSCRGVPFRSGRFQPQPLVTQCWEVEVRVEMRNGTGPWCYLRWEHENNFILKAHSLIAAPVQSFPVQPSPRGAVQLNFTRNSSLSGDRHYEYSLQKSPAQPLPLQEFWHSPHSPPPRLSALSSEWMPGLFRFIVLAAPAYLYFCTTYQANLSSATSLLKTICQLIPTNQT